MIMKFIDRLVFSVFFLFCVFVLLHFFFFGGCGLCLKVQKSVDC